MKFLCAMCLIAFGFASHAAATPLDQTFVRVNQVGYRPEVPKIAIAFSSETVPSAFELVDTSRGEVVFRGKTKFLKGETWGQFTHFAELNFSEFKTPGTYILQTGRGRSFPFAINSNVYGDLPEHLLEFMRQQRCGYNPWLDAACHTLDGRTAYGPMTNGTFLDGSGGWHDAGDLLKYLLTSGNATSQMLLAYRLKQEAESERRDDWKVKTGWRIIKTSNLRFLDRFNALGQSGANGIADILDEAKWGLDWMLKLHPERDQLFHQVADDRDHQGWRLPQNEIVDYGWGAGKERVVYFANGKPQGLKDYKSASTGIANLAGRYAAAMALAYQIWKDDERMGGFARTCLRAGMEVYALGKTKEGVQQGNSFSAPYRYEETTWADDMEWGAAELFRATGDQRYLADSKRYAELAHTDNWMGKEQTGHYQYYPFMNAGHFRLYDLVDRKFQKVLAGYYRDGIESCMKMAQRNPFRAGVPFIWCSNNLMTALATQCLFYERMTGDKQYREFASQQRDWLLGTNPWGTSMFTEIPEGGEFPEDVHLVGIKLLKRSVRGGLVDGPVGNRIFKSLKGVSITEPDPFAPFQDERAVYHDDIKDYSSNEPTMDGTASAILLWSLLKP